MSHSEHTHFSLQEGASINYFKALLTTFGGKVTGNTYDINDGKTEINMAAYPVLPGFEMITTISRHHKVVIIDREPDNEPDQIHIGIIKEGFISQQYGEHQQFMEAGTTTGVFIYNGLFPMQLNYPANLTQKSLNIKLNRSALVRVMPEAISIFDSLFDSDEPIAYHTHLPAELSTLMDDIFIYKKSEFGKTPMVVARGLELFTLLMKSVQKLVNKDELHGLHIDDYKRILRVKEKLLSSFEEKVNIENLATEFGTSLSKLKRDFKTLFDSSIYQFYTQAKMDEAYRRLKTGQYSVMEVGYDLGYQNPSKFSQMFKKVKGITPKDVLPL